MRLLMLALRNLSRNMRRTVITLAAISFGLAMMIATITLQTGSYDEMIDQAIRQMAGHVVVQGAGYQDEKDDEIVIRGASAVRASLSEAFPGATVAQRAILGGLLVSPSNSVGAGVQGIDPEAEAAVGELDDKLVDGAWLDDDDRGIVIGERMAESLEVEVGDKLVYMGQYAGADVTSRLFRVKGIFRTGSADMDGFLALARLEAAQELMALDDVAHQVSVHLTTAEGSEDAALQAAALVARDDLEVLSWRQALPELYALIQVDRNSGDVMLGILGLIVAMGVLNTVLMSVLERTREFGVMMGIGMRPRQIAGVVLLEGALLGALGAVIGVSLGAALSWPLVTYGIDYSAYTGGETMESAGVVMSSVIKGGWNPWRTSVYCFATVLFTALAAAYPAWHVTRLQPVEAIRHT